MTKLATVILIPLILLHSGCLIFPMKVVLPLTTITIDAETEEPIFGASVLRIVCDMHDFDCSNAYMDLGSTNKNGLINLPGKRKWGIWILAPGGLPAPNHHIAIWKKGYSAFVFTQYDDHFEKSNFSMNRQDIQEAINKIPIERRYMNEDQSPNELFDGGKIRLFRLQGKDSGFL